MKIRGSLSDFGRMAREIEIYKDQFIDNIKVFTEKVADYIAMHADSLFGAAKVDIQPRGSYYDANVSVTVQKGDVCIVIAKGKEAVFVEFGAGVYFNGSAGSSPHPLGDELGLTIGSYGPNGEKDVWAFPDPDRPGKFTVTRGTPAQMPMYRATQDAINNIYTIAQEVFR